MSQLYVFPPGFVNVTVTGVATEATLLLVKADLDALNARTAGGLVPLHFDEIDLTYVPSGNGAGQVATAVYKLASSTVATLTLTYDSNNKLTSVIKT